MGWFEGWNSRQVFCVPRATCRATYFTVVVRAFELYLLVDAVTILRLGVPKLLDLEPKHMYLNALLTALESLATRTASSGSRFLLDYLSKHLVVTSSHKTDPQEFCYPLSVISTRIFIRLRLFEESVES